jgi:hypothetical protein
VIARAELYDDKGNQVYIHNEWARLQVGDTYTFSLKVEATN